MSEAERSQGGDEEDDSSKGGGAKYDKKQQEGAKDDRSQGGGGEDNKTREGGKDGRIQNKDEFKTINVSETDDSLTVVVKKQEAALKRLEEKHGTGYGKPPPGSKSEARAKKYNENCTREIVELCGIVSEKGFTDSEGRRAILFRDIFNTYRFISDKCCGLLLRARRYKLLAFEGEMLFQGKDDHTIITMLKNFSDIHTYYKETKQLIGPDQVYTPAITSVQKE